MVNSSERPLSLSLSTIHDFCEHRFEKPQTWKFTFSQVKILYIYLCIYLCIRLWIRMSVCICVCMFVYVFYACMYACVYDVNWLSSCLIMRSIYILDVVSTNKSFFFFFILFLLQRSVVFIPFKLSHWVWCDYSTEVFLRCGYSYGSFCMMRKCYCSTWFINWRFFVVV